MSEHSTTGKTSDQIINRHIARLMNNLEQANCPDIFMQAVKAEMIWLRSDIREWFENERQENERG